MRERVRIAFHGFSMVSEPNFYHISAATGAAFPAHPKKYQGPEPGQEIAEDLVCRPLEGAAPGGCAAPHSGGRSRRQPQSRLVGSRSRPLQPHTRMMWLAALRVAPRLGPEHRLAALGFLPSTDCGMWSTAAPRLCGALRSHPQHICWSFCLALALGAQNPPPLATSTPASGGTWAMVGLV